MIRAYYHLTKPGIIRGNLITATAGFLLASQGDIDVAVLIGVLLGTSLVIACGCVLNNYLDREIDKKMNRTKKRALVTGDISVRNALIFAAVLGASGFAVLLLLTNVLTAMVGIVGLFAYVIVYGVAKRKTIHGTLVGSISGAVPPVAGYTAVTGQLDTAAWLLFLILVCWQMPHFYAIALYRLKDYKAAGIPVLPAVKGIAATKFQMLLYIIIFTAAASLLTVYEYTGDAYLAVVLALGMIWAIDWFKGYSSKDVNHWAHRMFGISLLVLLIWSAAVSVDSFLV